MPSRRERVRRADQVPLLVALYVFVVALCAAMALGLNPEASAGVRLGFALVAVPFTILIARTLPIGVYIEPGGVLIRNVVSSRSLDWGQIDRFTMGTWLGFGNFPVGVAVLADGKRLTLGALAPSFGGDMDIWPLIDDLNSRLGQATGRTLRPVVEELAANAGQRA